ncbi:MAG: hypothetical protein JWP67_1791 [Mucilaginibacter sp.]|nr:hypothetical protein [Mucilaginibacter sp.]
MKKNIFLKYLFLVCLSVFAFAGCVKEPAGDKVTETLNSGTTFVGFPSGMENSTFFDPFTDVKAITVFTIKKDAANNADLKKPENFVVTALPDAITAYNNANGTSYELLPSSFYTIATATTDVTASGNDLTFKFAPGDFSKDFIINLDGSKLDLSKTYALAYQLTNSDGVQIHAASKDTLYAFYSVKNQYDGKYAISGTITRNSLTGPDLTLGGTLQSNLSVDVATVGPNANTFSQLWADGSTVAGIDGLKLTVDPATNKVTVTSSNTTLKNTIGADNYYDPTSKTFYLAFDWGTAPNTRIAVTTLKYTGPR